MASRLPLEYLKLQPISAPATVPGRLDPDTFNFLRQVLLPESSEKLSWGVCYRTGDGFVGKTSILRASCFRRRVVTHSLADSDLSYHPNSKNVFWGRPFQILPEIVVSPKTSVWQPRDVLWMFKCPEEVA